MLTHSLESIVIVNARAREISVWLEYLQVLNHFMPTLILPPTEPTHIFDKLWLGTIWNAKDLMISNPGVGMVLNCTSETLFRPKNVHMAQLGLRDGFAIPESKIGYAIRVIHEFFQQTTGRVVLVCSHAAESRSAGVLLAYLVGSGMGFREAHGLLQALHPATKIHPDVFESIKTYFGSNY
jgi:hypothetical protein